jgi:hypothetical protein
VPQCGCSARHHKGPSVCANGLTIGEARLTDAVLAALRTYFASPDYERWLAEAYDANQRARARAARRDDEVARLEREVQTAEARVEKVTEALARIGYSEPFARTLRAEEERLLDAREALASMAPAAKPSIPPASYSCAAVPRSYSGSNDDLGFRLTAAERVSPIRAIGFSPVSAERARDRGPSVGGRRTGPAP